MKRLLLLLCFGIMVSVAGYSPATNTITIATKPPIRPYEALWDATCKVESNNDPNAIGDKKLKYKSYGIAQIRKPRLDDYFRQTGIKYNPVDMFDTIKSKSVFMWYAMQYPPSDIESISRCWNGGSKGMKKQSTKVYYKKVLLSL
jgi:hypothetical protein